MHKKANKKNKQTPKFDLQGYSYKFFHGVDLFVIEGINQNTVLSIISEIGNDIRKFHSGKCFASWLHLCPNQKITGGRVIANKTKRGNNVLSQALKSAANAIGNLKSTTHLTKFFKRIQYKNGRKEAITATAHKLAVIIYKLLTTFQPYKPYDNSNDELKKKEKEIRMINKMIEKYKLKPEEVVFSTI